jgi:transglutaminase/protease-like cytokinesis protein 3
MSIFDNIKKTIKKENKDSVVHTKSNVFERQPAERVNVNERPKAERAEASSLQNSYHRLRFSLLMPAQQSLYLKMERMYLGRGDAISFSDPSGKILNDLVQIHGAVLHDNPELFYVNKEIRYFRGGGDIKIYAGYCYDRNSVAAIMEQLDRIAKDATKDLPSDPFQREIKIHDYILKRVIYPKSSLDKDSYHNIVGALIDGTAVCEGISMATMFLMTRAGIQCGCINGTLGAEPHAWNIVRIGSHNYHLDVTNNGGMQNHAPTYRYFNMSDEDARKVYVWTSDVHCNDDTKDYYSLKGWLVRDVDALFDHISGRVSVGERDITFRLKDRQNRKFTMESLEKIVENGIRSVMKSYSYSYTVAVNEQICWIKIA